MSQSSLLKNLPDFFNQKNLEKAQMLLRQPTSLAILASLGIHGLLGVSLPLLSNEQPNESAPKRPVKVVELSPAERMQLPDMASQFPLPASSAQSNLLTPPSSQKSSTSPSDSSSLYNFSPFPSSSSTWVPPDPSGLFFPNSESPPTRPAKREAPPPAEPPVPPPPPASSSSSTPSGTPPSTSPSPSPSPSASAEPRRLPEGAIAALREQQEKLRQEYEKFAFNPANTKQVDFDNNVAKFGNAIISLSKDEKLDWKTQKEIKDLYPKEACPFKIKSRAAIAALVQPDGRLAGNPVILLSSGYKPLDEQALKYVADTVAAKEKEFEAIGKYQPLVFPFIFNFESACSPSSEKPAS